MAGGEEKEFVIRMTRAATLAGRVYDFDGEPLANVTVQAMRSSYGPDGRKTLQPTNGAITDDLGEYRIFWLDPGEYFVSATLIGAANVRAGMMPNRNTAPPEEGYIPIYYPNSTNAEAAAPLRLNAGEELRGIDFSLAQISSVTVSGRVFSTVTGQPQAGVSLMVYPRGRQMTSIVRSVARTDAEGRFEIKGVTPGSQVIRASLRSRQLNYESAKPIEVTGADVEGVFLTVGPGQTIPGRLYLEGEQRGSVSGLAPDMDPARIRVLLRKADDLMLSTPNSALDEGGGFTLDNVTPGAYELWITGLPTNHYIKRALIGSGEIRDQLLTVGTEQGGALDILVSANAGSLEGSVSGLTNGILPETRVVLVPAERLRGRVTFYRTATVDEPGRFSILGIVPGDYKVFVWEELEGPAYYDLNFVRRFETRGEPVRIQEGSNPSVTVRAIPADETPH